MRNYTLCAIVALFICSCSSDPVKRYLGLKGKIETIKDTEYSVDYVDGEYIPDGMNAVITHRFDDKGNVVFYEMLDRYGELRYSYKSVYEGDKCVEVVNTTPYSTGTQRMVKEEGNVSEWEITESDGTKRRAEMTKNATDGCNTSVIKSDGDDTTDKSETCFDKRGNIIHVKFVRGDDVLYEYTSEFDDDNQEVARQTYYDNGEQSTKLAFKYTKHDEKGNWIEMVTYEGFDAETITVREIEYR